MNQAAAIQLDNSPDTLPWWKYGYLWLVIGGPLVVVIASFITLYLVIENPDPVYQDAPGGRGHVQAPAEENDEEKARETRAFVPAAPIRKQSAAATGGAAAN